jgi:hypothetical protein
VKSVRELKMGVSRIMELQNLALGTYHPSTEDFMKKVDWLATVEQCPLPDASYVAVPRADAAPQFFIRGLHGLPPQVTKLRHLKLCK